MWTLPFKSYQYTANSAVSREFFGKLIKLLTAFIAYPIVKKEVLLSYFSATVTALHTNSPLCI
ncbi:MAG: hypothetical protein ACQCN6_00110 [Candidatus Bathyarchaeia archaeon]